MAFGWRASDVQAPRVATLVDQFDLMNPARTPRRAADLMHQPEEHGRVDVQRPGPAETRFDAQMQHHEAFVGQSYEHRDTQRPTGFGHGEQRLYTFDVAHSDAQTPVLLVNLRDPVGRDG